MKQVGFLGGTFDPLHFGHLHLAIQLMERRSLDEVWLCPAQANPFKAQPPIASPEQRLKMLQLAIEGIPGLKSIDTELQRPGPSYTIDTIRILQTAHKDCSFRLLLGDDALPFLGQWKEIRELVALAPPLIGMRSRSLAFANNSPELMQLLQSSIVLMPVIEITATEVRTRLASRRSCVPWVPSKVLDFIDAYELY